MKQERFLSRIRVMLILFSVSVAMLACDGKRRARPVPPSRRSAASADSIVTVPCQSGDSDSPATVYIASVPPGAEVILEGTSVGMTNGPRFRLCPGTRDMLFGMGDTCAVETTLEFVPGENPSVLIRMPCL